VCSQLNNKSNVPMPILVLMIAIVVACVGTVAVQVEAFTTKLYWNQKKNMFECSNTDADELRNLVGEGS
jgi:hypothetical protein